MQLALTGVPSSGVKTIFSSLTGHIDAEGSHSWAPGQSRLSVVKIPDARLDLLAEIIKPKKVVHATVELAEYPGLFGSRNVDNNLVGQIRQADALVLVLRSFESSVNPHPAGSVDPARDLDQVLSDFVIADLAVLETRLDNLAKALRRARRAEDVAEQETLLRCREKLDAGLGVSEVELSDADRKAVSGFGFLSQKPIIIILNFGEDQMGQEEELAAPFREKGYEVQALCGSLESELAQLGDEEQKEFMDDFGLTELAAPRVLAAAYRTLEVVTYFTYGEPECRAWELHKGETAVDAAENVHTDLARGFIRAEVVSMDDFKEYGDLKGVKAAGKFRLEGRDYVVQEGDTLIVRHNA